MFYEREKGLGPPKNSFFLLYKPVKNNFGFLFKKIIKRARLSNGKELKQSQWLISPNQRFRASVFPQTGYGTKLVKSNFCVQFLSYNSVPSVGSKWHRTIKSGVDGFEKNLLMVPDTYIWCNDVASYLYGNNAISYIDSIKMQTDNNLVAYNSKNEVLWASNTVGSFYSDSYSYDDFFLELLDNGELVLVGKNNTWKGVKNRWSSFYDR